MTTAPEGGSFDWRSTESCRQLLALPRDGWAWEFLRCNPRYRAAFAAWAGRIPMASAYRDKVVHSRAVDVAEALAWDVLPFRLTQGQRRRWQYLLAAFGLSRCTPSLRRRRRSGSRRRADGCR